MEERSKRGRRAGLGLGLVLALAAASCGDTSPRPALSLSCANGSRNEAYPLSQTVECLQFYETGKRQYLEPDSTHEVQVSRDGLAIGLGRSSERFDRTRIQSGPARVFDISQIS